MSDRYVPDFGGWQRLSLDQLNERAPLLDRAENKYLVSGDVLSGVMDNLQADFEVLAIDATTAFGYETTYYDTRSLLTYRQHAQGKRLRLKVRSRRYLDSDLCFFEVKLKGQRGRTIKTRMPYDIESHGRIDAAAHQFLTRCVRETYGEDFTHRLTPALSMRYRRLTLVGTGRPERVTVDFDIEFSDPLGAVVTAPHEALIVEVKSERGRGVADRRFREAGARPASCSKYCVGLNMVRPGLRYNTFKRPLANHFGWLDQGRRLEAAA
ncbi:polyphosphate polymerase domain-containing protein [soil metagenome]